MADHFDPTQWPICHNFASVMWHVLKKGPQAGGVVGVGLVTPAVVGTHLYRGGKLSDGTLAPKVLDALYRTTLATTALALTMGVVRVARSDNVREGLEDRAYRLHYNRRAQRADNFSSAGMAVGGAVAAAFLPATAAMIVGGATAGVAAGLLAFKLTTPAPDVKMPGLRDM